MKYLIIPVLIVFSITTVYSQILLSPEQVIHEVDAAYIITCDVDNDGFDDIIISEMGENPKLGWIKNLGNNIFSEIIDIQSNVPPFVSMATADFNGDSYTDFIGVCESEDDRYLIWYKNDSNGNFEAQPVIRNNIRWSYTYCIEVDDIDYDGDVDFISNVYSEYPDVETFYYENDGFGNFSMNILNLYASDIKLRDLDEDSDVDLIYAQSYTMYAPNGPPYPYGVSRVLWMENNGNGEFINQHFIDDSIPRGIKIHLHDLNLDGNLDLITYANFSPYCSFPPFVFRFYENIGNGNFNLKEEYYSQYKFVEEMFTHDLDSDGNTDLILSGIEGLYMFGRPSGLGIVTGLGNWNYSGIDGTYIKLGDVTAVVDIDNDNDIDILSVNNSYKLNNNNVVLRMSLIENELYNIGFLDYEKGNISIYPNPATNYIAVGGYFEGIVTEIFDYFGRKLLTSNKSVIDLDGLHSGIYIVVISDEDSNVVFEEKLVKY